jgi:hypothetical protein
MKNWITKVVKKSILLTARFFNIDIYFHKIEVPYYVNIIENLFGHSKSRYSRVPVDGSGGPLPWFTYPAIEYLQQLDLSTRSIFEWGTGYSSLFFAKRAKEVISVESDKLWFDQIDKIKLSNNHLFFRDDLNEYVSIISSFKKAFDIIIIDGKEREKCSEVSNYYIKDDGLIILDNSDRHPDIAKKFRDLDYLQIDMHGFGPVNDYTWTTSFFFKRFARFEPISFQPVIPIGGGF